MYQLNMNIDGISEPLSLWDNPTSPENFRLILDALPVPLICIDAEQRVVLTNEMVDGLPISNGPIRIGRSACEYLPDFITGRMTVAIRTQTFLTIKNCELWGNRYHLDCVPFTDSGMEACGMIVFRRIA